MIGPGAGLASVLARGQSGAEELRRKKEQEEIQRLAFELSLSQNDVTRSPETMKVDMPDVSAMGSGMPQRPSQSVDTGIVDPNRYQSLGRVGGQEYHRDRSRQIAAERAASRQAQIEEALKGSQTVKNLADAGEVKAPVRGTPEYLKAVEAEERVRSRLDKGPAGSWVAGQKDGKQGFFNPTTQEFREGPPGFSVVSAGQANDAEKKQRSLRNMKSALDGLEMKLRADGSAIIPSVETDELATLYQNVLLQAKEMYELGVLNGPDYIIMQRVLSDPTSLVGRARSFGSGKEQAKRVLAQIGRVRKIVGDFQDNAKPVAGAASQPPDHSSMSDEEFTAAWKAGRFKKP